MEIIRLDEIISHINDSKGQKKYTDKCAKAYDALNLLWSVKPRKDMVGTNDSLNPSDRQSIISLFHELEQNMKISILCSEEVCILSKFTPRIIDQSISRKYNYDPSNMNKEATDAHNKFTNDYLRFVDNKNSFDNIDRLLKKLSEILYIVRNNIKHGEKTPYGPDLEKTNRDESVCKVIYPVLYIFFSVFFNNPEHRLACYGTLRMGEANSEILKPFNVVWKKGIIKGTVDEAYKLAYFSWDIKGKEIPVDICESKSLNWGVIDNLEREYYKRIWIPCKIGSETQICNVYSRNDNYS